MHCVRCRCLSNYGAKSNPICTLGEFSAGLALIQTATLLATIDYVNTSVNETSGGLRFMNANMRLFAHPYERHILAVTTTTADSSVCQHCCSIFGTHCGMSKATKSSIFT